MIANVTILVVSMDFPVRLCFYDAPLHLHFFL